MLPTKAYAAQSATSPLAPVKINRREPGPHDVLFEIMYCGICMPDWDEKKSHIRFQCLVSQEFPEFQGHFIDHRSHDTLVKAADLV